MTNHEFLIEKLTIKPDDFLIHIADKKELDKFSKDSIIEMLLIAIDIIREKNKKLEEIKNEK